MLPTVLPSELLLLRVPEALSGDVCGRSDALVVYADRPTDRTLTPDDFRPTERWAIRLPNERCELRWTTTALPSLNQTSDLGNN